MECLRGNFLLFVIIFVKEINRLIDMHTNASVDASRVYQPSFTYLLCWRFVVVVEFDNENLTSSYFIVLLLIFVQKYIVNSSSLLLFSLGLCRYDPHFLSFSKINFLSLLF